MQKFLTIAIDWFIGSTSKFISWFFKPFLDMITGYHAYKFGDFWHNIVMFFPMLSRFILLLVIVLLFAKMFINNVNHRELGSFTNKIILFMILIVAFSAMGLNMFDDIIFLISGLLAYKLAGGLLRAVKIWKY
jgi:hypothetical protein